MQSRQRDIQSDARTAVLKAAWLLGHPAASATGSALCHPSNLLSILASSCAVRKPVCRDRSLQGTRLRSQRAVCARCRDPDHQALLTSIKRSGCTDCRIESRTAAVLHSHAVSRQRGPTRVRQRNRLATFAASKQQSRKANMLASLLASMFAVCSASPPFSLRDRCCVYLTRVG